MISLLTLLSCGLPLAQATNIYTGFDYGAFWGQRHEAPKTYDDFFQGFSLAQNLTSPIKFDSARLFTCKVHGGSRPTDAFDAAVVTRTSLLLGFWISGGVLETVIQSEMSALAQGFEKHGQALADLVIGLSVGSEDIYRFSQHDPTKPGLSEAEVIRAIKIVKENIQASPFAKYMKNKPIGHVDTAQFAIVDGAEFYGMTAHPHWHNDTIAMGRKSFTETLEGVKQRAGNTSVIIGEMGWSFEGAQREQAVASVDNMQAFWTEMGCLVVGKHTTFWFELVRDAELDQPD